MSLRSTPFSSSNFALPTALPVEYIYHHGHRIYIYHHGHHSAYLCHLMLPFSAGTSLSAGSSARVHRELSGLLSRAARDIQKLDERQQKVQQKQQQMSTSTLNRASSCPPSPSPAPHSRAADQQPKKRKLDTTQKNQGLSSHHSAPSPPAPAQPESSAEDGVPIRRPRAKAHGVAAANGSQPRNSIQQPHHTGPTQRSANAAAAHISPPLTRSSRPAQQPKQQRHQEPSDDDLPSQAPTHPPLHTSAARPNTRTPAAAAAQQLHSSVKPRATVQTIVISSSSDDEGGSDGEGSSDGDGSSDDKGGSDDDNGSDDDGSSSGEDTPAGAKRARPPRPQPLRESRLASTVNVPQTGGSRQPAPAPNKGQPRKRQRTENIEVAGQRYQQPPSAQLRQDKSRSKPLSASHRAKPSSSRGHDWPPAGPSSIPRVKQKPVPHRVLSPAQHESATHTRASPEQNTNQQERVAAQTRQLNKSAVPKAGKHLSSKHRVSSPSRLSGAAAARLQSHSASTNAARKRLLSHSPTTSGLRTNQPSNRSAAKHVPSLGAGNVHNKSHSGPPRGVSPSQALRGVLVSPLKKRRGKMGSGIVRHPTCKSSR